MKKRKEFFHFNLLKDHYSNQKRRKKKIQQIFSNIYIRKSKKLFLKQKEKTKTHIKTHTHKRTINIKKRKMEKLAGLQHLVNAPKLSVANKIINLVFERRSTGFSDEEEAQISSILGGLSPEDTQSLLVAIRLLIKISLRKNIELTQIPQAFPDSVDKRLHPIILKILAAHVDTWRQEIAQDKAAAAPAPKKEESSLPPPPPPSQAQEPSKDETESEKVNEEEKEKEKEREAKKISELKKRKKEKEEEEEKEREREREKEKLRREKELQKQKQQQEEQEEEERRRKAAEEEAIRAKKKKRAAALAQQQQQQQQQQLKGLSGPSLPRLQGFDWRIDVRSASESVSNMIVPSVIVQMEVEKQKMGVSAGSNSDDGNNNRVVTFELNRETLETMLDGLIFVRDQLASIAAK